jgi:uncharacterized repeat protein (TIGR02543 family)
MKKIIFGFMAVLAIFAILSCDNGSTPKIEKVKVTLDLNYEGAPTATVVEINKGSSLGTKLTSPTRDGYTFASWNTNAAGTGTTITKDSKFNSTTTIYAKWTQGEGPGGFGDKFDLGDFTVVEGADWKGWATNGVDDIETELTMEMIAAAKYLVIETQTGQDNANGFGGVKLGFNGDGTSWSQKDVQLWGDWISITRTDDDPVTIVIDLSTLGDNWETFIGGTQGKLLIGYWGDDKVDGLGITKAELVFDEVVKPADAVTFTYGFIVAGEIEIIEPGDDIDLSKTIYQGAELVTLTNANQVVYIFTLPAGGKWSDYSGLSVKYLVPQAATFEAENSGRAQRVYGNYGADFFQFLTTDAGNKFAYAQLGQDDNGDSTVNNNQYILDDTGSGGWKTLSAALIAELGECPEVDEWFTITYKIDGTRANQKPHRHLPYDGFDGPFILGFGLPGAGGTNKIFMKDIKLVGKSGKPDVVGKALYISKDGTEYPAFCAYGNADGQAGEDVVARQIVGAGGVQKAVIPAPNKANIALLAGSERVSLTNAYQVIYEFVLPTGKTWADFSGVSASYLVADEALFDAENSGRAMRLYGNYDADFFGINTTTAGNKYAYASLDGNANNNQYILDDTGSGGWKSLSAALIAELGSCPEAYEWFTITYKTDGTRANVKPHKHLPADTDEGPFYFGLGLPGAGGTNTMYMKDVKLLGVVEGDTVTGHPLYLKKDGYNYPAFAAFGTAVGNGVDEARRGKWDGSVDNNQITTDYTEPRIITVDFDLNDDDLDDAALADANNVLTGSNLILKKNDSFLIRGLPTATTTTVGQKFKGWGLTADATDAVKTGDGSSGNGMAFSTSTDATVTLYAIWGAGLPDATEDLDITTTITGKIGGFGGLPSGEQGTTGGLGPYTFDAATQYSSAIDFNFAAITEITTYEYKEVKIEFTVSDYDGTGDSPLPFKLIFHAGRAHNGWSGGTPSYSDISANGAQTKTITLDTATLQDGIVIQHNGNSNTADPTTASAKLTITKVTLIKP